MASKKAQKKAQPKPSPAPKNQKAIATKATSKFAPARKASALATAPDQPDRKAKPTKRAAAPLVKKPRSLEANLGTPEKAKRPKIEPKKAPLLGRTEKASTAQGKRAVSSGAPAKKGGAPTSKGKNAPPQKLEASRSPKGRAQPANLNANAANKAQRAADFDRDDELVAMQEEPKKARPAKKSMAKPAENVVALPLPASKNKGKLKSKATAPGDVSPVAEGGGISSGTERTGVAVGDHAPSFMLQDESGTVVSSETLRGSPYVLYFYPKDDTPGCTLEACGFRDSLPRFSAKGVRVLGVSPDLPDVHARFKKKYDLSFPLLSDPEKTLAKAYGVWVKKQNYGREYMGVERSTFFVDKHGTVSQVWRGVKVPGHVDLVLDAV